MARSRILKLDGGRNSTTDGVNVDITPVPGVDVVADVSEEWPFERASFDRIEAHHVLDHVSHDELPTVSCKSSEWYARQPSWLLKQWPMRGPSLIEPVTSSYGMDVMEFTMRKRG